MPEADALGYFDHAQAKIGSAPVTLSRTGYTGDLGFEVTVEADARARRPRRGARGRPRPRHPAVRRGGADDAPDRGRSAAVDVEWHNSRLAFTDARPGHPEGARHGLDAARRPRRRPGLHRRATRSAASCAEQTSRWATRRRRRRLGSDWDRLYRDAGLLPDQGRAPARLRVDAATTTTAAPQVGYVTSFMYSPVLQRHIGLARVRPEPRRDPEPVHLEIAINHHNTTVSARTAKLPLFNPERKTA